MTIHRLSVLVFILAWGHIYLVGGTDALGWLYALTALAVVSCGGYWLWAASRGKPSLVATIAAERRAATGDAA